VRHARQTDRHTVPDSARLYAVRNVDGLINVLSEDRRSKTVHRAVGSFNHFVNFLELHDLHHWTEDLHSSHTDTNCHTIKLNYMKQQV